MHIEKHTITMLSTLIEQTYYNSQSSERIWQTFFMQSHLCISLYFTAVCAPHLQEPSQPDSHCLLLCLGKLWQRVKFQFTVIESGSHSAADRLQLSCHFINAGHYCSITLDPVRYQTSGSRKGAKRGENKSNATFPSQQHLLWSWKQRLECKYAML